jgi:hypothetical protein
MAWRTTLAKQGQMAAFKKAATWGTAAEVGANCGLPFKTISGLQKAQDVFEVTEVDLPVQYSAFLGANKPIDLTIASDMSYSPGALGTLIAMVFGTAGEPTGEGDPKTHTFRLADNSGKFGTLAVGMPGEIWEIPSVKPYGWTIKMGGEGFIESEIKAIGDRLVIPASVNTDTKMNAVTYDARGNHCYSKQLKLYINAQSGADFQESDLIDINSFECSFSRSHQEAISIGKNEISESAATAPATAELKIGFPMYGTDAIAMIAKQTAATELKAKIVLTGPIAGTVGEGEEAEDVPYEIAIYLPWLMIKSSTGKHDDIISADMEFLAKAVAAAPTGMSYGVPYMTITNLRATDYLA